jgi:hypothetical protein
MFKMRVNLLQQRLTNRNNCNTVLLAPNYSNNAHETFFGRGFLDETILLLIAIKSLTHNFCSLFTKRHKLAHGRAARDI